MNYKSTEADMNRVIDTIVLGFSIDPIVRWLFSEPHAFLANFPTLLKLFGGGAFEHNSAYHTDEFVCSALWLPPDVHPDEEGIVELLEEKLDGPLLQDAFAMFEQMDKFHPVEPCWHLAFIATDPAQTGRGYGSKLLEHTLRVCDADKKLAYLESTNPANITLYQRHGFELAGEIQAGSSPTMYPMRREPR
jgi:ribosomal protein S18 acetylase RimI-like enzyme